MPLESSVTRSALVSGIAWAFAAGACWGLAFIAPVLLPGYDAREITAGRYAAYGLFSIVALLFACAHGPVAGLREPKLWLIAFALSLLGNYVYFIALTAGIQRADAAIAALIIGALPVLLPVAGNLLERTFPFAVLVLPGALMLAGIAAVHIGEHGATVAAVKPDYWLGIALLATALLTWTVYGVANGRAVKARPDVTAATWASLQGITLLPLVMNAFHAVPFRALVPPDRASFTMFIAVSLVLGIATSWVAMWCWNQASARLPAALAGQLIVFETLAALVYAYVWKAALPPLLVGVGAACLIGGVVLGLKAIERK